MKKTEMTTKLQEALEAYPQISLRSYALATETTYQVLLRESRKPVPGVAYDPEAVNYGAIIEACLRKHGQDFELPDFEQLAEGKTVRRATTATEWNVGDRVEFRNFAGTYEILMKTPDHLVFMEIGKSKPRVMNNDTFEHQGPRPVETTQEEEA